MRNQLFFSIEPSSENGRILKGKAIVYDTPSKLRKDSQGYWRTIIKKDAFNESLKSDIFAYYAHDNKAILGRTGNDSLKLINTDSGLYFELILGDTTLMEDVYKMVKSRLVSECSFGVSNIEDYWKSEEIEHNGSMIKVDTRYITGGTVFEITLTPNGAFGETEVSLYDNPGSNRPVIKQSNVSIYKAKLKLLTI